jgi:hypothetical protein
LKSTSLGKSAYKKKKDPSDKEFKRSTGIDKKSNMMKSGSKGLRPKIEEDKVNKQSAPKDMDVEFEVILRWLRIANARREPWKNFTERIKAGLDPRNVDPSKLEVLITKLFWKFKKDPLYNIDSGPMMERNVLFMTMSLNQKLMLLQLIDE